MRNTNATPSSNEIEAVRLSLPCLPFFAPGRVERKSGGK